VQLADGDRFDLRIAPVAKRVGGATVRMLAFNGSVPGPVLKVRAGSRVVVDVQNQGDLETTVHWHGLRLENRYDGTHRTQTPIQVGEHFTAVLWFPDPGAYWYHPHTRSDLGVETGLYGGIVVDPSTPDYWPPVHRELLVTLDDLLLEQDMVSASSRGETTDAATGRFGNVILVNGETDLSLTARLGEVLRLCLVNTANTRVFNVGLPGARMKLVGGDSGHVEQEDWVDDVVLAPSERAVVDVMFEEAGDLTLRHRTAGRVYPLASVAVRPVPARPSLAGSYMILRANPDMVAERSRALQYLEAPPDKSISFSADTKATRDDDSWKIVDQDTHAENTDIDWRFNVGDQIKIRLANERAGDRPMHHLFHIQGAGRFLVLSRDGVVEPDLVWKDTVLVRAGETVDILLDVTEPGSWMARCRGAEHQETGRSFSFEVAE
jgi:FtsP/CotA-like multicopper oxidase with cupredoxin domain